MFLNSPHLVSGYYGTIVSRFKGQIFGEDHLFLPYFLSALCYFRIEQFFRSGELSADFKKSRFHIMMLVKMIVMGVENDPLNSRSLEKKCEQFRSVLVNDIEALKVFTTATNIFSLSGIDLDKKQYKSESETELLIQTFKNNLANSLLKQATLI